MEEYPQLDVGWCLVWCVNKPPIFFTTQKGTCLVNLCSGPPFSVACWDSFWGYFWDIGMTWLTHNSEDRLCFFSVSSGLHATHLPSGFYWDDATTEIWTLVSTNHLEIPCFTAANGKSCNIYIDLIYPIFHIIFHKQAGEFPIFSDICLYFLKASSKTTLQNTSMAVFQSMSCQNRGWQLAEDEKPWGLGVAALFS